MAKKKEDKPTVVVFACHWGGYPLLEGAATDQSANIRLVRLMCGGRMSAGLVLRALESGVDGVAVVACDDRDCHYGFGSGKCAEEFELARRMSYLLGIEDERLAYSSVHPGDSKKARTDLKGFVKAVKKAGKSKVRAEEG